MPRFFRAMKKSDDDKPLVEPTASGLGVRPNHDIDLDVSGNAIANRKGMSVGPNWRDLPLHRIPKRLRPLAPGARGSDATFCFVYGDGPFQDSPVTADLELACDSATHGTVAPYQTVPLLQYEGALEATRNDWTNDEA